jgi:SAM-dependent methyltransferase
MRWQCVRVPWRHIDQGYWMPEPAEQSDAASVRAEWDTAADAYAEGQATGRDFYRLEFFGPAHVELCGAVSGRKLLDVGCGTGYFARKMACRGALVTGMTSRRACSPTRARSSARRRSALPTSISMRRSCTRISRRRRDIDPFGELGQRHPPLVEQVVELDDDGHVRPSPRGLRASAYPQRQPAVARRRRFTPHPATWHRSRR